MFGAFVPVSTNGGLTLWQGVADAGGRELGARRHDTLVAEEEADPLRPARLPRLVGRARRHLAGQRPLPARARGRSRANPGRYARVMLGRMGEMLNYASGEAPSVLREAPRARRASRAACARREGAPPTPRDEGRFLAPGRLAAPLRPLVAALQPLLCAVLLPLVVAGAVALAWRDWRRTLLLLSVSLYYLLSESPFIYEWRVVAPMHYGLLAAAAAALVFAVGLGARLRPRPRRASGSRRERPAPPAGGRPSSRTRRRRSRPSCCTSSCGRSSRCRCCTCC